MPLTPDEIRKRYAAMHVQLIGLLPDAYWLERDRYAEHRTRDELDRLLHYGHVIPMKQGITRRFVENHYPGWTWNQLVQVVTAADALVLRGGTPPQCAPELERLHFDSETGWLAEWAGPRITIGIAPPGTTSPDPARPTLPILDLSTGLMVEDEGSTDGSRPGGLEEPTDDVR